MKRLWLLVGLIILAGTVARTFADVQNIRLSGDIRLRGYFLNNVADDGREDDSFISQRTRVTVEADLEDHILVVVTLKAEGLWGDNNNADESSGAGTGDATGSDAINRRWEVGVTEAYVQFNEVFYSAATLKLGRQYLHYGRGLILSSVEQEYNYDAARLVLDYYPLTLDLVYALACEGSSFGANGNDDAQDIGLLWANARYEMTDSPVKAIEAYFGWLSNGGTSAPSRVPPGDPANTLAIAASPMIAGGRIDLGLIENMTMALEAAYEFGADGDVANEGISAWIVKLAGQYAFKGVQWAPALNWGSTWASGGGSEGSGVFRPWFDYVEGYNGYLFHPMLSNLHIINVGGSIKPAENTTLAVQGYYYRKMDRDGSAGSNPNIDFGSTGMVADGDSADVGYEIDTILGYDYSKDVRCQLVYSVFVPLNAIKRSSNDGVNSSDISAVAQEVRAEVNVRF